MTNARASEFLDYLLDQLGPLQGLRWRFMFGGVGLFRDEVMFAIVVDDALYLKTDEMTRAAFEAQGMAPFRYLRQNDSIRPTWVEMVLGPCAERACPEPSQDS